MSFGEFGLDGELIAALQRAGYRKPTPVQSATIPPLLDGHDLIGLAPTGTGKTAAYLLPLLQRLTEAQRAGTLRRGMVLILGPTRELAAQITASIDRYASGLPLRVATIHGGVDEAAQIRQATRGAHLIVATPGRLLALLDRGKIDFESLRAVVLDEADRMLHMGFLPDVESILARLPERRQTLMFSATFPKQVESLARRYLNEPHIVRIGGRTNPVETVAQSVYEVPRHLKIALLCALLREPGMDRVLVFVKMKDGADRLTRHLKDAGFKAARLHSSRSQEQRTATLADFKDGRITILVATDIVSRGIDIDAVSHVINFDFPVNPEDYVHRIGRTGRAGSSGKAISLVPDTDLNLLDFLELTISHRIPRKRLRGFDYRAPISSQPPAQALKKDWRKRARELEKKRSAAPPPKKNRRPGPPPR